MAYDYDCTPRFVHFAYKFTGKERDSESGNDYFGARYYGSSMGRMLSPDPDTGTLIHIMNPQRWNMCAYALNNPLTMTDPTGKDAAAINFSGMVAGLGHEGILSISPDGTAEYARFGPAEQTAAGGWGLASQDKYRHRPHFQPSNLVQTGCRPMLP